MSNPSLILGQGNWAAKANSLLGYAIGETTAQYVPREFTFSRGSTATYTNSAGLITSAAANIARVQGNALVLEPQRTNLFRYSEDFAQALWSKSATSVTANQTISPDGNNNGTLYSGNGTSNIKSIVQTITVTTATAYSISIYAKKGSNNFLQITSSALFFGTAVFANFDLNNGVLGSVGTGATASIQSVGNGWYRCTMTATTVNTGGTIGFYLVDSATAGRAQTNTLSTGVFIWGAQLEQGVFLTSYIPTTTATASRLVDSYTRNNIYTNGLISPSGGTWIIELKNNVPFVTRDAIAAGIFLSTNTSGSGTGVDTLGIQMTGTPSTRLTVYKRVANTFTGLYITTTDTVKIAIKWNGATADIFQNGVKVISGTAFTATALEFLNSTNGDVPKFIQSMALYNTPLSDSECITLTT